MIWYGLGWIGSFSLQTGRIALQMCDTNSLKWGPGHLELRTCGWSTCISREVLGFRGPNMIDCVSFRESKREREILRTKFDELLFKAGFCCKELRLSWQK